MESSPRLNVRRIAWFLAFYVVYFWTGIDGALLAPRLPFLITDELRRSPGDLARFGQIATVPVAFSLLFGFLRDRWPWGERRLVVSQILLRVALPCFLLLSGVTYPRLLGCMVLTVALSCMMGVTINATLATMGRRLGATGRLAAFVGAGGALLAAANQEIGGALGTVPFDAILGGIALAAFILLVLALRPADGAFPVPERSAPPTPLSALGNLLCCRPYLAAAVYKIVWDFGPAYGTPLTVRLKDVVGLSPGQFAHYGAITTVVQVFGSLAAAALAVRLSPRAILTGWPLLYLPFILLLFGMRTATDAYVVMGLTNLLSSVLNVTAYALLLRTVPPGLEGTGIALVATISVLLNGQGDVWATDLAARHGYFATVWATAALCLILPLLGRMVPNLPPEGRADEP